MHVHAPHAPRRTWSERRQGLCIREERSKQCTGPTRGLRGRGLCIVETVVQGHAMQAAGCTGCTLCCTGASGTRHSRGTGGAARRLHVHLLVGSSGYTNKAHTSTSVTIHRIRHSALPIQGPVSITSPETWGQGPKHGVAQTLASRL